MYPAVGKELKHAHIAGKEYKSLHLLTHHMDAVGKELDEGYEGKHDGNERHKADDAADAADDAINNEGLQGTLFHGTVDYAAQPAEEFFDPALGIGTVFYGDVEHGVEHANHDDGTKEDVGQDLVQLVGQSQTVLAGILLHNVLQKSVDVAVAGVRDHGFAGGVAYVAHALFRFGADFENFVSNVPMGFAEGLDDFLIAFDKLYGSPVGMVEIGQGLFPGKALFQGTEHGIDLRTVADAQGVHASPFAKGHCLAQDFLCSLTAAGNKIFQRDGNSTLYMLFNTREHEQTKDREIRRALAQAINTPELVKSLYKGFSSYAKTYFPSFMAGYSENTPTVTYDPEAAKKALAEKGVTKVKIIANSNASYSNTVGGQVLSEAVQAYLKEVGVEASIAVYDWATFKSRLMTDSWDLSFIGWNGDNGDPDNFINIFARPDANINQGLWQNEEFNALIEQGVHVKDGPERTKIYEEAERVLAEDVGIFPIAHAQNLLAYRPNIKNAEVHPIGLMFFKDVEKTVE